MGQLSKAKLRRKAGRGAEGIGFTRDLHHQGAIEVGVFIPVPVRITQDPRLADAIVAGVVDVAVNPQRRLVGRDQLLQVPDERACDQICGTADGSIPMHCVMSDHHGRPSKGL